MGDHVRFRDEHNFGRIDHILLLDNFQDMHIFVILTPMNRSFTYDHILGQEIMYPRENEPIIVGVTAILPERVYLVQIPGLDDTIWINWDVQYM